MRFSQINLVEGGSKSQHNMFVTLNKDRGLVLKTKTFLQEDAKRTGLFSAEARK